MINYKKKEIIKENNITALENSFPITEISKLAEQESWRKEINRPIYHIHKWWATRLGTVFRALAIGALTPEKTNIWEAFYENHNLKNKIVFDPFMGSGTTIGETLKLGARAVGSDINPVSTFLVNQALRDVSEKDLIKAYNLLEKETAPKIKQYYQTIDPNTEELVSVLYYFWVKTVDLPNGEKVPLFSNYVFASDAYPKKKPLAKILCSECWSILEERYDATLVTCSSCKHSFNPQEGPVTGQYVHDKSGGKYKIKSLIPTTGKPLNEEMYAMIALTKEGKKIYLPIKEYDRALYSQVEKNLNNENLPLPSLKVRPGYNTIQATNYNYLEWKDFFNKRQLLCLGILLKDIMEKIEDKDTQEQMLCLFSSTLEFNNMFCSFKGEGTGAVRHMFSNHILKPERRPLENSIWGTPKSSGTFSTLFTSRLLKAKKYLNEPFEIKLKYDVEGKKIGSEKVISSDPIHVNVVDNWNEFQNKDKAALILNGDSSKVPLPDSSIDAVITDPPYFDYVNYSELSDFFFAWLSPVLKERYTWFAKDNSYDKGEVQHKDPQTFSTQLSKVFTECHRVLKEEGILTFSFHHSQPDGWAAIYQAINKAGFVTVAVHPVHAEARGASPKSSTKEPISLDILLVCRKKQYLENMDAYDIDALKTSDSEFYKLQNEGMTLSLSDRFVISAAQVLIKEARNELDYTSLKNKLIDLKKTIFEVE